MKDTSELYAYRIIKTGEEDKTDYTVETFYNYWLHDFRDGVYRMCNNLGRHGNTPIQDIAYKEIKKYKWSNDEMDFLFQICCEFGFEFNQGWNEDNDYWILYGDFDKHQIQYLGIEPWQICYAYIKCSENDLINYEKHIKEICTDLLDYIYNELN